MCLLIFKSSVFGKKFRHLSWCCSYMQIVLYKIILALLWSSRVKLSLSNSQDLLNIRQWYLSGSLFFHKDWSMQTTYKNWLYSLCNQVIVSIKLFKLSLLMLINNETQRCLTGWYYACMEILLDLSSYSNCKTFVLAFLYLCILY